MTRRLLAVALALGLLPAALRAQANVPPETPAMLRPGDRVEIQVYRNSELSGAVLVDDDGALQHPLYRDVVVAGIPIDAAEERLRAVMLQHEQRPLFVFIPQFRVYVGGAVRDQNQQYFPEISVGQAITRAGGSTTPTRKYRVHLIRDGMDYRANLNDESASGLLQAPIRSGDQILLEERPTFTRNVLNPSLQVLQTVTSLVASYVFLNEIFK